ncbi:MAG: hypothetical protein JW959_14995 [Pirellulales bacterium]|nr:hypothetical protein [Pirellulales bacterium]
MKYLTSILLGGFCIFTTCATASSDEWAEIEQQFRELPIEARRLTGPLFWLHGDESQERLEAYLGKVVEGGNGCFVAESRPHSDWLGEGWYRDLKVCLEAAKKRNLKMWIFDERWWPSQSIGGKVRERWAAKSLAAEAVEVEGPKELKLDGYAGERYIAAVAGQVTTDGTIDGDSLVDLAASIKDGVLTWSAPAGKWRIMKFTHVQAPGLRQSRQLSIDGASQDCVEWYIRRVYQPHYDRFKDDFGKTIVGFFYDEPETCGDWGAELNTALEHRGADWKKAYVAYKFELAGQEQTAAKYAYLEAFADAWGRTLYGGLQRWCRERGVESIGHFMEHQQFYLRPDYCAGDMMRLQRFSDMGGIDAVYDQFKIGGRVARDEFTWQTPKLASSVSHVFGKKDDLAMVEIFGARGQDLTYREMKWWTDHMQVSGVNFMVTHSFNPRAPYDNDCPPYFYNGGFEPRWPLYRVWADYTNRLSLLLSGGRHDCPAAVLFSGNLGRVGKMIGPEGITTALQNARLDCDWLPMDVFEKETQLDGNEIKLHDERYRILVVPPVEAIPYETLTKVKEFYDNGGTVIGYGFLPSKSVSFGHGDEEIVELRREIWGDQIADRQEGSNVAPWINVSQTEPDGGCAIFFPEMDPEKIDVFGPLEWISKSTRTKLRVICDYQDGWLHVLHRVKSGRDVFMICNQRAEGPGDEFLLLATAEGEPELWDPMRNEITAVPYQRIDEKRIIFGLALKPLETVMLVFRSEKIERPARIDDDSKPIREPIALVRAPNPPAESPTPDEKRRPLTLGPVKAADPFRGRATIPADVDLTRCRVFLEMEDLPDEAAAVTVNGEKAGGVIGRPLRLDISEHVKPGENDVLIEPLAPKSARLAFYPR